MPVIFAKASLKLSGIFFFLKCPFIRLCPKTFSRRVHGKVRIIVVLTHSDKTSLSYDKSHFYESQFKTQWQLFFLKCPLIRLCPKTFSMRVHGKVRVIVVFTHSDNISLIYDKCQFCESQFKAEPHVIFLKCPFNRSCPKTVSRHVRR